MSELDDLLSTKIFVSLEYRDKAKQQIKDLFLELIGNQDKTDYIDPITVGKREGRNKLKQELRKKVKEL